MKSSMKYLRFAILLIVFFQSCFNPDKYINPDPNHLIGFDSVDLDGIADGVDAAKIKVKIHNDASLGRRKVVFKTDLGFFKEGKGDSIEVEADANFYASANLVSLKEGKANVSVKIKAIEATENPIITFSKAYPETISVTVDSFSISNNYRSEALITASMGRKNGGKPSVGHPVKFLVKNTNGGSMGAFLNNIDTGVSNTDGKVKIRYSAGEINQEGFLTITAITNTVADTSISATTRIYLSKTK